MSLSWVMSCFCGLQEKNHVCGVLFFSNMVLFFNKQFQNRKKCLHNFRLSIIELCVHNSRMDNPELCEHMHGSRFHIPKSCKHNFGMSNPKMTCFQNYSFHNYVCIILK